MTIKEILFPGGNALSQSALRTLATKQRLDPDILRVTVSDSAAYRAGTSDRPVTYQYWGSRIVELHEELENPTPRGLFWRWLERKSGARHASEFLSLSLPRFPPPCVCVCVSPCADSVNYLN